MGTHDNHRIEEVERRVSELEVTVDGRGAEAGLKSNQLLIMADLYSPNDGIIQEIKKTREFQLKVMGGFFALQVALGIVMYFLKK